MSGPDGVSATRIWSGERSLTLDELRHRARRAASAFDHLGVGAGDSIALLLRNDFPFLEATWAAGMLGAAAVPLNWHGSVGDVDYIVSHSRARAVVVHEDLLDRVAAARRRGVPVIVVPTPQEVSTAFSIKPAVDVSDVDAPTWDTWLAGHSPWAGVPRSAPSSVIYTSGTTGRPKGVQRDPATVDQVQAMAALAARLLGVAPGSRVLVPLPLYHAAPNAAALFAAQIGATIVLEARFDPEALLALIERFRITSLVAVPTMFVRLLKLDETIRRRYDLGSLVHVSHTAAPCPPEVKRRMIDWLGPVLHEYYGSTEIGAVVACTSEEWLAHPGTVGRPVDGAVVKILREDGTGAETGEIGEVYARLTTFSDFTYASQDDKRREIDADGLVTIGDIGYLDADGYLYLCDRKSDMLIFGGTNVYPAEIEAVLIEMPEISDCAVFGIPDEEFGEVVAAAVEARDGVTVIEADVLDFLRPRVATYKLPRHVDIVEQLPREASGKILKRKLRERHRRAAGTPSGAEATP